MQAPSVCPACGNSLFPDARFCHACGAPLTTEDERTANVKVQESTSAWCAFCGSELSRLNRSPRRGVCFKCFANESVWKKISPPNEWELGKKIKLLQELELWKKIKKPNEWVLAQVNDTLDNDESVVSIVSGWHSYDPPKAIQRLLSQAYVPQLPFLVWPGYFIATTTRIIFYVKKPTKDEILSYPLSTISSIRITKEWFNRAFGRGANHGISFECGNKQVNLMGCAAAQYDETVKFVDFVHANKGKISSRIMPSRDVLDELQRLADLRDKGIITEDEFQSKKQVMLEKIT